MSADCVVDANVVIKLFLVEPSSEGADALFGHLADTPAACFYVPDLLYSECASVLWKYVRRFGYPLASAQQDMADLIRLPLRVASTADLAEDALSLAAAADITAYDASYAVLARRLRLPLVTADEALVRRLAGHGVDARLLED